jgi:hypothetical protein
MSQKSTEPQDHFSNKSLQYGMEESAPSVATTSPRPRIGVFLPALQIFLFFTALGLHTLRSYGISLLGRSLSNWFMPPECMILSILFVVLAVQHFIWEAELAMPSADDSS